VVRNDFTGAGLDGHGRRDKLTCSRCRGCLKTGVRCAGIPTRRTPIARSRAASPSRGDHPSLTFDLERRSLLRAEGWYASDHHAHMIYGDRSTLVDFPYVALAGPSEGLDFLSMTQAWNLSDPTPENLAKVTRAVSTPDFLLT
jgi:hypothetical protein